MIELAIQIHPMVPLAKASAILKISRDELIRRLSSGELLGEKRRIGESKKDSWFIYADEFNRLLTQAVAKYEERVSTRGMEHIFSPGNGLPETQPPPPAMASDLAQAATETVAIEPVAVDHTKTDLSEIVDALGTNYAMGSDYDLGDCLAETATNPTDALASDFPLSTAPDTGLQIGQAMVAQLMQHLQDERQCAEALKVRLSLLEEEVEQLRREVLARPDRAAHSPLSRVKNYFRLLLGVIT